MTPLRQAVVVAGGRGTRLGGLTAETPKPLLPVGGRPFVEWVIAGLGRQGIRRVVLTVGYRAEAFRAWVERHTDQAAVELFVEEEALGTGGALPLLQGRLDPSFLVLNGDTVFDVDVGALDDAREEAAGTGAVALRRVPDVSRYGEVCLDGPRVGSFSEKGRSGPGLINGGVYALTREAVADLRTPASIEHDLLPTLVERGALVGVPSEGFFIDIGIPESYQEAQRSVPQWWRATGGER